MKTSPAWFIAACSQVVRCSHASIAACCSAFSRCASSRFAFDGLPIIGARSSSGETPHALHSVSSTQARIVTPSASASRCNCRNSRSLTPRTFSALPRSYLVIACYLLLPRCSARALLSGARRTSGASVLPWSRGPSREREPTTASEQRRGRCGGRGEPVAALEALVSCNRSSRFVYYLQRLAAVSPLPP